MTAGGVHEVPDNRDDVTDTLTAMRTQLLNDDQPDPTDPDTAAPSDGVVTAEWRKYGKHRIYANSTDGTRLGWIDVPTGDVHLEDSAGDDVTEALRDARDQVASGA